MDELPGLCYLEALPSTDQPTRAVGFTQKWIYFQTGTFATSRYFLKGENEVPTGQKDASPDVPATHPCSSIISCSSMHFSSTRRLRSWSKISR